MVEVIINEQDDLERALRRLRRKMVRSGLMRDMKKHRFYEKPSTVRRKKQKAAARRRARARRMQRRRED